MSKISKVFFLVHTEDCGSLEIRNVYEGMREFRRLGLKMLNKFLSTISRCMGSALYGVISTRQSRVTRRFDKVGRSVLLFLF